MAKPGVSADFQDFLTRQDFPITLKKAYNHNNFLANLGAHVLLFGTVFLLLQSFKQLEYEKRSSS
jgi:hypothetical protein